MDNKTLYKDQKIKQDFKVDWKQDTKGDFKVDFATFAAPVAALTADHTSGAHPFLVNFTSNSTGQISSYAWNFGDGNTSTLQNPSHTYAAAGTYTVSLTVTGPGGSNMGTRTGYITIT